MQIIYTQGHPFIHVQSQSESIIQLNTLNNEINYLFKDCLPEIK